ncbi:DUF6531 domain-containing protein [Rathayibacter tanaceti]|uniref:Putative deoxyribonuclease RhsC n=1 Tax=Rathayibacter tanaceti TaxID=1671680 RepID=A0A162J0R0_9MICO|nr:DUF6531 domain-containing protein [Rathayibacter tanaceti]KZX20517.1 putative deoxyribonuclease RhsC [Rathayibacter tanaceti]
MDLGAIEEDVPFDDGVAKALIAAFDAAASAVAGQAGSRSSLVTTALADFRGRFAQVFESNARVAASDAVELTQRLREVSSGARQLRREAHKEQKRRQIAREWQREQDARNLLERAGDALFGSEDPPVGPAAEQPRIPVEPASTGAREIPAPGGGGTGGGTSAARPDHLRAFAASASTLDDDLAAAIAGLRGRLSDFTERCRWGAVSADGVVSGADTWLTANRQDAAWARTVADAFAAAGGEGVVSTVADSALAVALASAGIPADRRDLTIEPAQALGAPPSTGYSDDPVNTATGNFLEIEVDLVFDGGCSTLRLERSYNSLDESIGAFGRGWSSITEQRLRLEDEGATWVLPDGREILFPREGSGWARAVGENRWLQARGELLVASDAEGTTVEFAAAGRWLASDSGRGTRVSAEYVDGRLVRLRHARRRWVDIEWRGDRIVAALASDGRRVEYRYDDDRLVSVSHPEGSRLYSWNGAGLIESVTAASGVVEVVNEYDARRRVRTQRSPFGRVTRYAYLAGRATVVSDEDGSRSNTWIADSRGCLVGVIDPEGRRQSMSYDAQGNLLSVVERDGAVTAHAYDERGRRIRTVTPSGADVRLSYDARDRVVSVAAGESVTVYEYADDETRDPALVVDPEGGRTALTWSEGLLTQVVDPVGVVLRMTYDEHGDLIATTDADGRTARLERDVAGRVTAVGRVVLRRVAGEGTSRYRYDAVGRLIGTQDPQYGARRFRYDAAGQLVEAVNGVGGVTRYDYDQRGRLVTIVDPTGGVTRREYDAADREVARVDPLGRRTTAGYDAAGRRAWQENPDGHRWEWHFDAFGREKAARIDGALVSEIQRDPRHRRLTITDHTAAEPVVHLLAWDRAGRLLQRRRDGDGLAWEYNADGARSAAIGPDGAVTRYERDLAGRITAIEHPLLGRAEFSYDPAGRITSRRPVVADRRGSTVTASSLSTSRMGG